MRIKVILLLVLCLFLLTSCCVFDTREVKHISQGTLYELQDVLDPDNNYSPSQFRETYWLLCSHFDGGDRLTRREAEECLEIIYQFTSDLLENIEEAQLIIKDIK